MTALRDEILKKYGVGKSAAAPVVPSPTIVDNAVQAPATSGQPATSPTEKPTSTRDRILSKYLTPTKDAKTGETSYKAPTPAPEKTPLQTILDKKETISQAPEQSWFDKAYSAVRNFVMDPTGDVEANRKALRLNDYAIQTYNANHPNDPIVLSKFTEIKNAIDTMDMPSKLMSLGVVAGTIADPLVTLPALATFTAIDSVAKKTTSFIAQKEIQNFSEILPEQAPQYAKDFVDILAFVGEGFATHGVIKSAPNVVQKVTKDIITTNKLPQNVYIEPSTVFDHLSGREANEMLSTLGMNAKELSAYRKSGVSIEIPAEKVVTMTDKPWFSKIKGLFRVESTPEVLRVDSMGKPQIGPRALLEAPKGESVAPATETPGIPGKQAKTGIENAPVDLTPAVQKALDSKVTPELPASISNFSEPEMAAFGKKLIDRISEATGGEKTAIEDPFPSNIKINEMQSPDGRPAQFNNQGKIEIFMPNLMKDIADISKGGEILAHDGIYSRVYKINPGETIQDFAVRYVRDIVIHEASHQKTLTIGDKTEAYNLNQEISKAKSAGQNTTALETKLDKLMSGIEDKALAYEKAHRTDLEKEYFVKKEALGPSTKMQRQVNRAVSGEPAKKITLSEKTLLKERIKSQATGARAGLKAGKEIGAQAVAETKGKYEETLKVIDDKQGTLQQKRQALVTYAEEMLPISERGKFIRAIRYPGSEKEFGAVLTRMRKAADTVNRSKLMSEITKELKETIIKKKAGYPNVKFEINAQRKLNSIRAFQKDFETRAKTLRDAGNKKANAYSLAQQKIADLVSDWQTAHPDDVLSADVLGEVQLLKMVGIKGMNAKELRGVLDDIKSIKETGRTLKEIERFNRDSEIQAARDTIQEVLTGGKPLPSESMSLKHQELPSAKKTVKEFLTLHQWGLEELLDSMSKFNKSKPYESFLSRYVTERTNKAFNEQNRGEMKSIETVNAKMKEIYAVEKNSEILSLIGDMQKRIDLGKIVHTDGVERTLEISRGEAVQMYMWLEDPTLAETFSEGLKWGPEVIDSVKGILKPEDIKMGDALLEFYRNYYEDVNKVFSKEYGTDLPFNENYSPVSRNVETTMPENILLAQEMQKYATAKNASLKSRVKSNIELKPTDAFENVTRHIAKMEHYKAWSNSMFEFRKIFGDKQLRRAIIDFHGEGSMKVMDNFLNDFARDGVSREKVVKIVDQLRSNTTKALLGLNWRVGAKQLTGLMNYGIELPSSDFFSGVASFWSAPLEKSRFLFNNSPMLQERFGEGFERDIKYAISKGYDKTLAKTKNFSEMMFILIRNSDKFTVYQGSWSAYRSKYMEMKRLGKSDKEAKVAGIKYAEDITNRVQESSRMDTLSSIQRGGSWAKLLTMFQSQPSKFLRIIENAARNYKYGRGDKMTNVKRIAWAWLVTPLIYNLVAEQFVEDKYKSTPGGMLAKTALGPLSYPLIAGQMFQSIYGWVGGERFAYTPSAVFSFMDDIQKGITQMKTGDVTEAVTYFLDTAGKLSGTPSLLITRPLRSSLKNKAESPKGASATF